MSAGWAQVKEAAAAALARRHAEALAAQRNAVPTLQERSADVHVPPALAPAPGVHNAPSEEKGVHHEQIQNFMNIYSFAIGSFSRRAPARVRWRMRDTHPCQSVTVNTRLL